MMEQTEFFELSVLCLEMFLRRTLKHLKPEQMASIKEIWKCVHIYIDYLLRAEKCSDRDQYLVSLLGVGSSLLMKFSGILNNKEGQEIAKQLLSILERGRKETNPFVVQQVVNMWHELICRSGIFTPKTTGRIIEPLFHLCFHKLQRGWYGHNFFDDKKSSNDISNKKCDIQLKNYYVI
eukprot:UN24527